MNRHERRKAKKGTAAKNADASRPLQLNEMGEAHLLKLREAVHAQQSGDVEHAAKIYRSLLKKFPDNPDCLNLLGAAERSRGNAQAAVEFIQRAIDHSPQPTFFKNLANALNDLNKYAEARDALATYFAGEDGDTSELNFMGSLLHKLGEYDEALAYINKALTRNPVHAPSLNNLAAVYLDMRRLQDAKAPLDKALELVPENSRFIGNCGLYFAFIGDNDKAMEL